MSDAIEGLRERIEQTQNFESLRHEAHLVGNIPMSNADREKLTATVREAHHRISLNNQGILLSLCESRSSSVTPTLSASPGDKDARAEAAQVSSSELTRWG